MRFYLIAADVYIHAGNFEAACLYLRAALAESNRCGGQGRSSIMRALNYARRLG